MASGVQTLRFRRPINAQEPKPAAPTPRPKDTSILQDQTRRHDRPWCPSFSLAIRILLLTRFLAAMYSNISDCDEVFNFWEPLHYLDRGYAFQTWETSPVYAIRSYAYVLLHLLPVRIARILGPDKRLGFFAVRIALAATSTVIESKFYRAVVVKVNARVGRYLFFMLMFNAGMWSASSAFLPSSFGLLCNTLAFSYAIEPASTKAVQRTIMTTLSFAAGAVVGWPFTLVIAIPFVYEELFLRGVDHVPAARYVEWISRRWTRFLAAAGAAALLLIPVTALDTLFYGRLTITPWNIISYNLLSSDTARGPELYGTEPWYYYILNLALAFNVILPLALASLPALAVTYFIDRRRLGLPAAKDQSSQYTVLAMRLAPVYLWLGVLTAQPHKEERFAFPAYTMICFNAAVTLYLIRGWMEAAYVKATASPYRASRSSIFRITTFSVVTYTCLISVSRILALWTNYHAPLSIAFALETQEIPRLLNISGLLPESALPSAVHDRSHNPAYDDDERIDISGVRHLGLTVCVGKEWHRFPGHYLIPEGVNVAFVKSEFDGLVPGKYLPVGVGRSELAAIGSRIAGTRAKPQHQNDLNKEELSHYVDISKCDYLFDLDFPLHEPAALEPRYIADTATWEHAECRPFLDAAHSPLLTRTLWLPGDWWRNANAWGEWCLLRRKGLDMRAKAIGARVKAEEAIKKAV